MRKIFLFLAAFVILSAQNAGYAQTSQKWFTTYYATWSMLPLGSSNFALPPWEMDMRGLTHIVLFDNGNVTQTAPYWAYMFNGIPADAETDSIGVEYNANANPGDGVNRTHYMDSLITIAHRNGVKVVITIQAVAKTTPNLNYVAADSARTQLFVNTLVAWSERKKFDGVELDWEGWAGTPLPATSIVDRFVRILYRRVKTMKTYDGAPGLIMVSAGSSYQDKYSPSQDYMVDQFNLQLYDYAFAWYGAPVNSNSAWHISPLHEGYRPGNFEGESYETRGPLQWVAAGHDPKRIGLGIPTYGYILRNVDALFQPITNSGDMGSAHYQQIEDLKTNGGVETWDDVRKVRSISGVAQRTVGSVYYGSDGINAGQKFLAVGENPQSMQAKVEWMKANNFGGIMTYDFVSDLDPTKSIASNLRNPLQRVVANAIAGTSTPVSYPTGTFTSSASSVPVGGGSVTLSWTSANATSAVIDQGVGTVALNGSKTVTVTTNKTFTLTLSNASGVQKYIYTVTVNAPAASGTLSASASSLPIGGGSVTLTWTSVNATSASIDQGVGTVAVNGSATVNVASSKTFTLTLTNAAGASVAYTAAVSVALPAAAPITAIYSDNTLAAGWSMDGSYSATFDFANTEKVLAGSTAMKVTASAWAGVFFRHGTWSGVTPINPTQYDSIHVAIHGGATSVPFAMWLADAAGSTIGQQVLFTVPANVWTIKSIPMSQFGAGSTPFAILELQVYQSAAATFYVDDFGFVTKSAPVTVTVPAAPSFASPVPFSTNNPTSVSLTWTKIPVATAYHVQVSTDLTFGSFTVNDSTLTDTVRAVTGLANGTKYFRRVRAKNTAGWGSFCATCQFTTIIATLGPPALGSPANGSTNQPLSVVLNWTAVAGASTYRVQVAKDSLFTTLLANDSTQTTSSYAASSLSNYTAYYWRVNAKNASGTSAFSSVRKFTTLPYTKTNAYFIYASMTGSNATVAIPAAAAFSIGGAGLAAGDEIGVFTPSGLCVGSVEWNGTSTAITVWGDNSQTTAIDGIRQGETIQYRVYRQAVNTLYTLVAAQYSAGTGMYQGDALFTLASLSTTTAPAVQTSQTLSLVKGWNMISSNVKPNVTPMDSITKQLSTNMTIVKNGAGQVYWPSMSVNTIGFWNYTNGYMIYMAKAATMNVAGIAIVPDATPIALSEGWNLAPYVRSSSMNVATATAAVGSALMVVKNSAGQIYWPSYGINTLGTMVPGQAYQIYASKAATLAYPANALAKTADDESIAAQTTEHYTVSAQHGSTNEILLVKAAGLNDGDEVAVKTATGMIAGAGVVSNGAAVISVWSDDEYTTDVDGAVEGEALTISRWSKSDAKESRINVSSVENALTGTPLNTGLVFTSNAVVVAQSTVTAAHVEILPTEYALNQNYPNPFNPSTVIKYALPAAGSVTLTVYNSIGALVATLVNGSQNAGTHEVSFNAAGLSSGMYIYILRSGSFTAKNKMLLLK